MSECTDFVDRWEGIYHEIIDALGGGLTNHLITHADADVARWACGKLENETGPGNEMQSAETREACRDEVMADQQVQERFDDYAVAVVSGVISDLSPIDTLGNAAGVYLDHASQDAISSQFGPRMAECDALPTGAEVAAQDRADWEARGEDFMHSSFEQSMSNAGLDISNDQSVCAMYCHEQSSLESVDNGMSAGSGSASENECTAETDTLVQGSADAGGSPSEEQMTGPDTEMQCENVGGDAQIEPDTPVQGPADSRGSPSEEQMTGPDNEMQCENVGGDAQIEPDTQPQDAHDAMELPNEGGEEGAGDGYLLTPDSTEINSCEFDSGTSGDVSESSQAHGF